MGRASDIRAGAAYVELYVRNNRFVRGLSQASARLRQFGAGMMRIGVRITAAGAAIVGPILAAAKAFAKAGDALDKMSARTSLSVEFLSKLAYAADLGGSSIEAMEKGVRTLQGTASDAADGLATYTRAFDALGVSVTTASGELKPTEQLFMETVTALSKMENATKKAALASDLFGRAGTQLLPMLKGGKEGMLAVMKEAERLGYVLSTKDATAAAELTDAMARVKMSLHAVWIRVGSAVAEMLTKLANRMAEMSTKVIDFVKRNQPLIAALFKVGAAIVAAGVAFAAVGAVIFGLGVTLGGFATAFIAAGIAVAAIGSALSFLLTPIGLVAAAVVGLGGYFLYASGQGTKAFRGLAQVFGQLKADALRAFGGISDALQAGNIQLAAQVLWAALKMEWQKGINWLTEKWVAFKEIFAATWTEAVFGLATVFTNAVAGLETIWAEFTGWFVDRWKWAEKNLAKGLGWIIAKLEGLDVAQVIGDVERQYALEGEEREKRQARRLEDIERERQDTLAGIAPAREAAHAERRERYDKQLAESAAKLKAAQDALTATIEEAAEAKDVAAQVQAEWDRLFGGEGAKPGSPTEEATDAFGKVAGTYSWQAAQRLGMGGNAQERTANATEEIVKNTMELRRARRLRWV